MLNFGGFWLWFSGSYFPHRDSLSWGFRTHILVIVGLGSPVPRVESWDVESDCMRIWWDPVIGKMVGKPLGMGAPKKKSTPYTPYIPWVFRCIYWGTSIFPMIQEFGQTTPVEVGFVNMPTDIYRVVHTPSPGDSPDWSTIKQEPASFDVPHGCNFGISKGLPT